MARITDMRDMKALLIATAICFFAFLGPLLLGVPLSKRGYDYPFWLGFVPRARLALSYAVSG
jgi:dolichyl-phosphate-mannose--protein O-mannosyl transferase